MGLMLILSDRRHPVVPPGAADSRRRAAGHPGRPDLAAPDRPDLNVASGVGFIALFGVAVQNGIIMVANLNRMRKAGLDLHEAIMKGATERCGRC
jgi:hypothetical protein